MPGPRRRKKPDLVAQQYDRWIYPEPIQDLEAQIRGGWVEPDDPALAHLAYWPDRGYPEGLDILVAGCGTNQAAHIAYQNPLAHVVGVDLSATAIRHSRYLQEKHGLGNLTLHQMNLEQVSTLGLEFDFILSSGVLHHLRKPARGLKALRRVLRPHGVLALMLYARYYRTGVYMLQELFKTLALEQDQPGVDLLKATLDLLPARHAVKLYTDWAPDLNHDGGLVDTFLHRQDQAYTVRECLELLEECGLKLQGWQDNFWYYPDATIPATHPLFARLSTLEPRQIWESLEQLSCHPGPHCLIACHADRPESEYALDFDRADLLECVPVKKFGIQVTRFLDESLDPPFKFRRMGHPETSLSLEQFLLFGKMNGKRTLAECLEASGPEAELREPEAFARGFVKSLWRMGHILLRTPGGNGPSAPDTAAL